MGLAALGSTSQSQNPRVTVAGTSGGLQPSALLKAGSATRSDQVTEDYQGVKNLTINRGKEDLTFLAE